MKKYNLQAPILYVAMAVTLIATGMTMSVWNQNYFKHIMKEQKSLKKEFKKKESQLAEIEQLAHQLASRQRLEKIAFDRGLDYHSNYVIMEVSK